MAVRIQVRRGTSTQWNTADPILNEGEIGYNSTLGAFKIGDGSTAWSSLDYYQTTAEITPAEVGAIATTEKGAANGVAELDANQNVKTTTSVVFEGSSADEFETILSVINPTADRTITISDVSGTVITTGNLTDITSVGTLTGLTINGNLTVNGTTTTIDTQNLIVEDKNITIGDVATPTDTTADGGGITLKGTTDKTFNWVDATDSWTSSENINLASGKTYFKNGTDIKDVTETLTNKTISGASNTITNVANTSLTNSSITINGTPVSLGGSINIAGDIESVSAGTGLTGGGTSGAVTLSVDTTVVATTNNTLTLSNKTIALGSNTVSGTTAQFNTALTDGDFATLAGTEILTNKTLTDSTTTFQDNTDNTKKMQFELSGITTATTRTLTVPNVNGTIVTTGDTGTVTSTMIADGTIVNADINTSAAIALSKLASGTSGQIIVANASGVPTWVSESGDVTISDTGVTAIASGVIVDADISASAAIDKTKISGTAVTLSDTGTVTSTMIADGTIVNADINASAAIAVSKLASSTISGVTLGNNLNALTIGTGLSGTSYNGSSAVTVAIDSTVATTSGSQTLTNKTIALGNNTVSGTTAQFNTALTDGDFATLAGSETLTNKTLGSTTALGANLNAATFKITSLGTPTASTDAATKQYVDDLAQGLHIHASCITATTSALTATYANGSSGVGATLTNSGTQAALVIDGVTLAVNDRVLVKNQASQLQNGIYTVTNIGSVSTNWVMTRATDMDESLEVDGGDFVFVTGGTVNDNTGWVQTETNVVVGTNNIIFTQFSGAGTYLAGNGLTLTGNTFSINTGITADLSTAQTLTNKTINGANNTLTVRLANDISGFGTGVATFLATPSSANLASAVTDETGSGSLVFATSPTLVTPNIGVATGTSFNSITGLSSTTPLAGGTAAIGTSATVARADHVHPVSALTIGTGLTGTSYNGSSAVTIAIDSTVATTSGTQTLTNKTIALGSNTVSGTLAQFNTALTDADFASLAGTETLTNKTIKETSTTTINANTATTVDTMALSSFTSARYIVSIKQGTKIRTSALHVQTDGTSVDFVEYGTIQTGGLMTGFAITATTSSTNAVLNITITDAATTNATVKINKVVM